MLDQGFGHLWQGSQKRQNEPLRRLYFAGEHCSADYWGFMNGAAETSRSVAEKVLKRMRVR